MQEYPSLQDSPKISKGLQAVLGFADGTWVTLNILRVDSTKPQPLANHARKV